LFLSFAAAAASGAACTVTGATASIGAADTLDALFLSLVNIPDHKAQNGNDYCDNDKINRFHRQLFTA